MPAVGLRVGSHVIGRFNETVKPVSSLTTTFFRLRYIFSFASQSCITVP